MNLQKRINKLSPISIIPFLCLISIGLIYGKITYHQKIFKTLMIFVFDIVLLIWMATYYKLGNNKDQFQKKGKYFLYFALYFFYILFQFIVSYMSGEVSYDREYYLGNYIFLILFSMFFFLYYTTLEEVEVSLLLINLFFVVVLIWSIKDFRVAMEAGRDFSRFRPKLSFGNTNYFAGYAIGVMPLGFITSILFYNTKKPFYENIFSILNLIIVSLGIIPLIFTQTRAAHLGWAVGMFLVFIPSLIFLIEKVKISKRLLIIAGYFAFLIIGTTLLLKFPPPFIEKIMQRLLKTLANPEYFLNDRYNGWAGGINLFKEHPIAGAGLGTVYAASFKYIHKYYFLYSKSNSFKHSHNEFVEALGEGGIIGMALFVFLFGFIIVMMLRRVYANKYKFNYRAICLGVAVGLISMLVHQIYSLTLRMSVTMTAYFFLLGLGVFLISYTKQALVATKSGKNSIEDEKSNIFLEFLNKPLSQKQFYILFGVIAIFIVIGLVNFLPVFRSENNIIKSKKSRDIRSANYFINKAIEVKPDNPYAWTTKWDWDRNYNLKSGKNSYDEKVFDEIEKDLDTLNSIIPGYQDVWSKYSNLYITKMEYYANKWKQSRDMADLRIYRESLDKALQNLNATLDMNFLSEHNHLYRIILLSRIKNREAFTRAIRDYVEARIYLDFCRKKKVVKENIAIDDADYCGMTKVDGIYHFTIGRRDINEIVSMTYRFSNLYDLEKVKSTINKKVKEKFKAIYE